MINLIYKDGRGHKMARPVTLRTPNVSMMHEVVNRRKKCDSCSLTTTTCCLMGY